MKHFITKTGELKEGVNSASKVIVLKEIEDLFTSLGWKFITKGKLIRLENPEKKIIAWVLLHKTGFAHRTNLDEFRFQIQDSIVFNFKTEEGTRLVELATSGQERFLPIGFYHDKVNEVLIFSVISSRRIQDHSINRSYYVSLSSLAEAQSGGFSYFHDSFGDRTFNFKLVNFPSVIKNLEYIF